MSVCGGVKQLLGQPARAANPQPPCRSQPGMLQGIALPTAEQRGISGGPRGTASRHVNAAPDAAALQQTLRNGLFCICISFASHMGSVFPFSLFFFNSVFPSHNNQRFPAPPSFYTAGFDWFQSCRCSFGLRRRGKGSLPFQREADGLAGGMGEAPMLLDRSALRCGPSRPLVHLVRFAKLRDNFSAEGLEKITSR